MTETRTTRYESPERQRLGVRSGIRVIKEIVSVEDYLTAHGVEVKHGRARCIIHGGDNPQSFAVYPKEGRWRCFRCNEGGDLIDLCEMVEKHADTWTAMISLATQFNVDLPQRPQRWHSWQNEKARRRKTIRDALTRSYQRRFFRVYGTYLEDIADPAEREDEARRFFEDLRTVAVAAAENRMSR